MRMGVGSVLCCMCVLERLWLAEKRFVGVASRFKHEPFQDSSLASSICIGLIRAVLLVTAIFIYLHTINALPHLRNDVSDAKNLTNTE